MRQYITGEHWLDKDGNPAGGKTVGTGINIDWQNGPLSVPETPDAPAHRRAPNGAFVEGVIEAAIDRLEYYQESKFACDANAEAIVSLEQALNELHARTRDREDRGVEGTHAL